MLNELIFKWKSALIKKELDLGVHWLESWKEVSIKQKDIYFHWLITDQRDTCY
jgi:hypothetical protein